jgi:adenylate cyclase
MDEVMESGRPVLARQHFGHFVGAGRVELALNAAPLMTADGVQIGATMIVDDISERLALEAERDAQEAEKKRLRETLGKLVSEDVADLATREEMAGQIREVSCLFVDIVGFTARCEELPPARVIDMLNRYFTEMCEVVARNNGTVKQFVGDEIMVLFNAARDTPDHQMLAVWTAIEMIERLNELRAQDPSGENGFYDVKIGVHAGPVVYGAVGAHDRMEFAAVGDTVNLTSRVMGLNPRLGTCILISEDVYFEIYRRVSRSIELVPHGAQQVRGRSMPIKVYEVRSAGG